MRMDRSSLLVMQFCLSLVLFTLVSGLPALPERRVSRDLDQANALRTQLQRLQEKISHLEASEMERRPESELSHGQEKNAEPRENDAKAESDISSLVNDKKASDTGAISDRQRQVQNLSRALSDKSYPVQVLKEALQTLHQEVSFPYWDKKNSAGEYLGDKYPAEGPGEVKASTSGVYGESDRQRVLEAIYQKLVRLYHEQVEEEKDDDSTNASPSQQQLPYGGVAEDRVETRGSAKSDTEFRDAVLEAFEVKLAKDLTLAQQAGFSADEIIADLRQKSAKDQRLRLQTIQKQLDDLDRSS